MSRLLTLAVFAGAIGLTAAPAAPASAAPAGRQAQYADAARSAGVPERVLLAVSYLESRWDTNRGVPSTSGGYGPMHLTERVAATPANEAEDARGDTARPALVVD